MKTLIAHTKGGSYHMVGLLILLAFLTRQIICNPTSNEDDQLPSFNNHEEEPLQPSISILEHIKRKSQYTRQNNAVIAQGVFGNSRGMSPLSKMLSNALMNQVMQNLETDFLSLNISTQCKEDVTITVTALLASENWALRIVDAAGKLGSGVLEGNLYMFGSYDECLNTVPTIQDQNNKTIQPFKTQFVITYVPLTGSPLPLQWASCVPNSCAASDITEVAKEVLSMANINTQALYSSVKQDTFPLDGSAIGMICFLSLLLAVLIVATGYDLIVYQPMLALEKLQEELAIAKPAGLDTAASIDADGNAILGVDEHTPLLPVIRMTKKQTNSANIGPLAKALVKMSMFSNAAKLLHTGETSESVLRSVHGVRLASMSWVILGHTYFFSLTATRNILVVEDMIKMPSFQAIINATVSVDTFFLISGILVAYLVLREMREKGGPQKINWLLFYCHRIWRLTPTYMVVLAAYTTLYKYFGNGPIWPGDVPEPHCKDNWWINLLYINNIYKSDKGCMMWSWYLANDMQFYMISPIILIPLYFHFGAGLLVTLVLMVISFVCTGVISAQNAFPPSTAASLLYVDKAVTFFQDLYMVPWCRIGPYLVGILVGYALYRTDRKVTLKWYTVTACWMLAAGCNLLILYGLYDVANGTPISNDVSAFYNAVHRTMWACGVGWVIFACVTGYGGPVNAILSWPALIPLSRLTYLAYLVHPIVMQRCYQSIRSAIYLDTNTVIYLYLAHFVLSYGVAFVISLAIEAPMLGLEKLLLKR